MSEFRKDPLTGLGVIIAPERAQRPSQFGHAGASAPCPFCPGNEALTTAETWADRPHDSPANGPGWSVRVVSNKYPAVTTSGAAANGATEAIMTGEGIHEVIVESAAHGTHPAALDERQCDKIFHAYRQRLRHWRAHRRWRYGLIFKNHGERAGASFEHSHAQLVVLPFVPAAVENELSQARAYHERAAGCYYCAMIASELDLRARVVASDGEFVAICPAAPRFAFETWILPRAHAPAFEDSNDARLAALGKILRRVLGALDRLHGNPAFNYSIQSQPWDDSQIGYYHWQLRLLPQLAGAGGFEWSSGIHINPVPPEAAARQLRDALV